MNRPSDIWLDLKIGNITINEAGKQKTEVLISNRSEITMMELFPEILREELHKLLDKQLDEASAAFNRLFP